ncbi:hypothetical protein [Caulobacter hibisci]|nr:hypothetical protein [Caulobacter hibisci]
MAYISLEARSHSAPRHRVRWGRVAVLAISFAFWAGLISLAVALF